MSRLSASLVRVLFGFLMFCFCGDREHLYQRSFSFSQPFALYRQEYRDLAEARASIEHFLEKVYNEKRLHSSLGYLPPGRIRALAAILIGSSGTAADCSASSRGRAMSFLRHEEIYRPMSSMPGRPCPDHPRPHRLDEFPSGYSLASYPTSQIKFGSLVTPQKAAGKGAYETLAD